MNCVTTALMVSTIVISISAKKMTEGQSDKGLYTAKRVSIYKFFKSRKSDAVKLLCLFCH